MKVEQIHLVVGGDQHHPCLAGGGLTAKPELRVGYEWQSAGRGADWKAYSWTKDPACYNSHCLLQSRAKTCNFGCCIVHSGGRRSNISSYQIAPYTISEILAALMQSTYLITRSPLTDPSTEAIQFAASAFVA